MLNIYLNKFLLIIKKKIEQIKHKKNCFYKKHLKENWINV